MTYVVADPGSCWNGKREYGRELIRSAKDAGADAIKFQLFDGTWGRKGSGNIVLDFDMFREFMLYGEQIGFPVTASIFTKSALDEILKWVVPFVKLAYSMQRATEWIASLQNLGRKVVVSSDADGVRDIPSGVTKLYRPEGYPPQFLCNFEGIFPPFDGFSDHTLGVMEAMRARDCGATWFEKHITLSYSDIHCDDSKFALTPKKFKEYCKALGK